MENKRSNEIRKHKQNYKPTPIKHTMKNTATVMEVLMKAEAEQTNSISSGWKRELLHYNMREDLPEKKHLFLWADFANFAKISPPA